MKSNSEANIMDDNALNRSVKKLGEPSYRGTIDGSSNAQKWNFSSNNHLRNVPKMDHSAGGKLEMELDKQQDDPQLDMAKKDIRRLEYENNQLRAQVEKLHADRDAVHSALDEVHDRLEDTTSELQKTRQELAIKCKELAYQEHKAYILPQQSQTASEDELERMQMDLRAKDGSISQQETLWKERIKKVYTEFEAKLLNQEEKAQKLLAEQSLQHRKVEREWEDNIRLLEDKFEHDLLTVEQEVSQRLHAEFRMQHQKAESGWENDIRLLKQKSEDDLNAERETSQKLLLEQRSQHEEALGHIQKLQVQLQSAQLEAMTAKARQAQTSILPSSASIQASNSPPSAQAGNPDVMRKMVEELQASHAAELDESRRLTNFFKSNSERVSRELRELRATNRGLMESVEAKDREIEDQLSHIYAVEAQMEEFQSHASTSMPGGWDGRMELDDGMSS
jgi:hypothetical protein